LRFGAFELDPSREELRRSGVRVKLQAQPFKVLHLLARRPGELVTREEIQEHVWGADTYVDFEQGINVCVRQIRQVLGDRAQAPRFVETVPRRGYRFVAPVEVLADGSPKAGPLRAVAPPATGSPAAGAASTARPARGWWLAGGVGVLVVGVLVLSWLVAGEAEAPQPEMSPPGAARSRAAPTGAPSSGEPGIRSANVPSSVPRIVVLPFEAFGEGDPLADGLTEEIITELVRDYGGSLGVIARTTSMSYKGSPRGVAEIAAELGVDWVLEGSVRRDGDRVRVTAQLIGADDLHRWANEYDRELHRERVADLDLQGSVADTVARAVALNLGLVVPEGRGSGPAGGSAPVPPASTPVPQAHEAYLEGLHWLHGAAAPDPRRALELLRRSVELDPGFAAGWLGVAVALAEGGDAVPGAGVADNDRREEIREALERALDLDESLPDAHRRLALIRFYKDWDLEGARASWERALELAPHFAEAHHDFAAYWSVTGHHERALEEVDRARALDPRSPGVTSDVGWYSYFAGRPAEAVKRCRETLGTDPGYFWAEECILVAAVAAGDWETARARALANLEELEAPAAVRASVAGETDPRRGLEIYLRWSVDRMEAAWASGKPASPTQLAVRHMMSGNREAALVWLERAVDIRFGWILPFLPVHPLFDPLRDDPRFEELLERILK